MTDDQKAAYINAQVALFNAEIAGMVAENTIRAHRNETLAYPESAFSEVMNKYDSTIGHNAVISFFHGY